MARLAVLAAMFVTACTHDGPAPSSASAPAPEPATTKQCGPAQLEDLRRSLVGTCLEPSTIDVQPLAIASWAPVAELEPAGFEVVVTPVGVGLGLGREPTSWNEPEFRVRVREELETWRAMAEAKGEWFTPRFVLAIHRDTRLADIDPVLRVLAAEQVDRGFLAFASGTRPRTSPPRHPEVYARYLAEIDSEDPSERASHLARTMESLVQRCPALERGIESAATTPGPPRCETMMTAAAEAIIECGCPEYEPELVSWLQVVAGPADAAHLHIDAIQLAPARAFSTKPGMTHRAKPGMTWAALIAERDAPLATLWLDLAE